ncbi:MAG: putative Se/S carrier-like protein [Candidatus Fimenecus sp.]
MKNVTIKVGSVTYAMKAKNILQHYGMRAKVIKTVSTKKNEGCGYSVLVENPKQNIGELLRREGIAVSEMKWSQ